jgi:hypothetical protein
LGQTRVNIEKIRYACTKVNRDPKDVNIAAIIYPNIMETTEASHDAREGRNEQSRQLLSGNIDQVGNDLREVKKIGVDYAILSYKRSPISNNIDKIIDVSKQLWRFVR